jgi:cell division protease FtsH
MYAGLGARRNRQLFQTAKKTAPCIIFIDELDSVGGKRSGGGGDGAVREGDQTLNQLLTEIDGFTVSEHPVILLAATNRFETLDSALLRPGRFDRHIAIDPPDRHGRLDILKVHGASKRLHESVDLEAMSVHSSGMSGADLAQWLNEAALMAARHNHESVTEEDIDAAFFRIVAGVEKKHGAMSEDERKTVAYHEAGHAIIGERLQSTERVHKISIIRRGRSGGQTISVSEEDVFLHSDPQLRNMLAMLLGGRAAEQLVFGHATTGAADDLKRATILAIRMFTQQGMGKALGLRVAIDKEIPIGPEQQAAVDSEVQAVLDSEYERAYKLLEAERVSLDLIAQTLLVEETIDRERFLTLLDGGTKAA